MSLPARRRCRTWSLVLVVSLASCASYNGQPVKVKPPDLYEVHAEMAGVSAGGEAFFTKAKAELAFDRDVTQDFMPVLVSIRNDSNEFVSVTRSDMVLVSSDGKPSRPSGWQAMYSGYKSDVAGNTIALGLAGGAAAEQANDEMSADWQSKQFPEQAMLTTGRGAGGFVYFRRNGGRPPYVVEIVANKMKTQKTVLLRIELK